MITRNFNTSLGSKLTGPANKFAGEISNIEAIVKREKMLNRFFI
jgi:hypothetical protein